MTNRLEQEILERKVGELPAIVLKNSNFTKQRRKHENKAVRKRLKVKWGIKIHDNK